MIRAFLFLILLLTVPPAILAKADSLAFYKVRLAQHPDSRIGQEARTKLAMLCKEKGDFTSSLFYAKAALIEGEKNRNQIDIGEAYSMLGFLYSWKREDEKSLECFLKAEKYLLPDPEKLVPAMKGRADMYLRMGNDSMASQLYKLCYKNIETYRLTSLKRRLELSVGNLHFFRNNLDSALYFYSQSLRDAKATSDSSLIMEVYLNIGNVYCMKEQRTTGLEWLQKALQLDLRLGGKYFLPSIYYNLASNDFSRNDLAHALSYAKSAIQASITTKDYRFLLFSFYLKAGVDSALGLIDSAYTDRRRYMYLNDSIHNAELYKRMGEMQAKFDLDKKEDELKLLGRDKDLSDQRIRRQVIVSKIVTLGLLIFSVLSIILFRNFRAKQSMNRKLTAQKNELDEKRKLLAAKSQEIKDSLEYAKRLQEAVLPASLFQPGETLENFVFYKPKDMVSGDFYWRFRNGDQLFIAVADCTGHGVPGAMMSILGYDLLEYAVKEMKLREPGEILTAMNNRIIEKLFKNNSDGAKDGMDITLFKLNLSTRELTFSGAKNELVIVSNGSLNEYVVDKKSIGYRSGMNYQQERIILNKNDMVYLFSDGYADQKGGEEGKKFNNYRMRTVLTEIAPLGTDRQHELLNTEFMRWKGLNSQRDDIIIVGFRCI